MSITALITGQLIADIERRTAASGKSFATFRLAAGADDERVLVNGIAFGTTAEQLSVLAKGDTVAVVGRTKPKAWFKDGEPKAGLDIVADQVLSAYHLRSKRAVMAGEGGALDQARGAPGGRSAGRGGHVPSGLAEDDPWLEGGPR
jgi:single-stranded DNA-binding protein